MELKKTAAQLCAEKMIGTLTRNYRFVLSFTDNEQEIIEALLNDASETYADKLLANKNLENLTIKDTVNYLDTLFEIIYSQIETSLSEDKEGEECCYFKIFLKLLKSRTRFIYEILDDAIGFVNNTLPKSAYISLEIC